MTTYDTNAPHNWGYVACHECGRLFDLLDGPDADEWHHGHDCEPEPMPTGDRPEVVYRDAVRTLRP